MNSILSRVRGFPFVLLLGLAATRHAAALEVSAGDYEVYPPGINIGLLYYQHAETGNLYANGTKVASDFRIKSDVALLRYIRPMRLADNITFDPQFILPIGTLHASGAAAALGHADGVGDLILAMPFKFLLDPKSHDTFAIAPFVYVPVGSYDHDKPLNLGSNVWKGLLQLAYLLHFNASSGVDMIGDMQVSGSNDKYGTADATLKQAPRYELQAHAHYNVTPATALTAGYGYYTGANDSVDGVSQHDRLRTQYARLGATSFLTPTFQLQGLVGRDVKVENGPEQKLFVNLRFAKIF